jgi:dTDP-glucose 4,6-dehydratase
MKNILITGSEGVIGSCLNDVLSKKGYSVFGVDLFHKDGEIGFSQKMVSANHIYSRCDISNYRDLERIFSIKNFDFVYNCAAEFGRWNGEDYYEKVWQSNAIGLKNIIRLQEKYKFKLIHFSSSEVYGDYDDIMFESVMETKEIKQLNDYALSKWVNEQQIRNSFLEYGTSSVIVRIFNTYGPGEFYHPYRSVNAKFCYHLLRGIPIDVYIGHKRTSTYLLDTVNTISNICENFIPGEIYNIGGDSIHTIEELAEIIVNETNADKKLINFCNAEKMTTKTKLVDISKSVKDLNHKNTISLENGVRNTVAWMRHYYNI